LKHPAWKIAAESGISDVAGRIAIEAVAPIYALALPFAVLLAFLAGYLQAARRAWCWSLVKAFVIAGVTYASVGILLGVVHPGYVLFERKMAYANDFTGTFINRNTAADYFGVCLLAAATIAFREWRQNWPRGYLPTKEKVLLVVQNLTSGTAFWSLATAALLVAVLLTGSRAGTAFSAIALVVLLLLLIRKVGPARRSALIMATGLSALLVLHFYGTGNILTRVSEGLTENDRYRGWSSSLGLVKDYPLFGTGLGTFKIAFPGYRQNEHGIMQVWEQAHSTPLELAVELGLPALSVVLGLCGLAMIALFRGYLRESDSYAAPALGFSIMLLVGLHSLVDFPLQIPGCAIPIALVLGAIFRQSSKLNKLPD
jgi:O-antigen ligase